MNKVYKICYCILPLVMWLSTICLAQDYSGVEKFDLSTLESEIKDAKLLRGLNNTKDLIDHKHGCGEYANAAKKQRQSLIKLQTEYQIKPVNDRYADKDKAYRAAFTEAVQTYEKCFDYELSNFPYLVNVANINSYTVFKQERKTLRGSLAKRGDLNTYITMLQELIVYEKETLEAIEKQPPESQIIEEDNNKPSGPPPAITMENAAYTLTKMLFAYHDKNPARVSERLAPDLQKTLFQNVDTLGLKKGLFETVIVRQQPYNKWRIKCAACWNDPEKGNLCKFNAQTYWGNKGKYHPRMFIVQNIGSNIKYEPKITAIYNWEYYDYKRMKKHDRVCKTFPYHFSNN